jgi:hypothetical protein
MAKHKRTRTGGPRGLAAYQRARRQEWLAGTLHEVAVLEGRLMGVLGLDEEALRARLYSGQYLAPWERLDVLTAEAARVGV